MDFQQIYENYYTLYRGESQVPSATDDEFTIGLRLANTAIGRWASVDNVFWKELYSTNLTSVGPNDILTTSSLNYTTPDDTQAVAGIVELKDGTTVKDTITVVDTALVYQYDNMQQFCYFVGDPTNGFTLRFNKPVEAGLSIDYIYYKKPTYFVDGSSTTEMSDPWYIVHSMLANRFRVSRNFGAYQTALRDAEEALKNMQQANMSGNQAMPWTLPDTSGTVWGG